MGYHNARTVDGSDPVTLDDAKDHLRIDGTDDDPYITDLITAARQTIEHQAGIAMMSQTWVMTMDAWPGRGRIDEWWDGVRVGHIGAMSQSYVELPIGPLISVDHLKAYSQDNTATIFDSSNYFLDTIARPGRLILNSGVAAPISTRSVNGIEIQYVAGYGAIAADVPGNLKHAVMQLVAHWYEHREVVVIGQSGDASNFTMPLHVQTLIQNFKVRRL